MRFTSNRSDRKQNRRQGRREEKKRYLRHVTVDEEPSLRRLWRLKLKMDGWLRPKKTNKQSERKVDTIFLFAAKKSFKYTKSKYSDKSKNNNILLAYF